MPDPTDKPVVTTSLGVGDTLTAERSTRLPALGATPQSSETPIDRLSELVDGLPPVAQMVVGSVRTRAQSELRDATAGAYRDFSLTNPGTTFAPEAWRPNVSLVSGEREVKIGGLTGNLSWDAGFRYEGNMFSPRNVAPAGMVHLSIDLGGNKRNGGRND